MYKTGRPGCKGSKRSFDYKTSISKGVHLLLGILHNIRAHGSLEAETFSDLRTGAPTYSPFLTFLRPCGLPGFCVALLVGEVEFL